MLRLIIAVLFISGVGFSLPANAAGCNPGDDEVAFFQNGNFGGTCIVLGMGAYENSKKMRMKNDSISSFIVGKFVQVRACNHASNIIVGSGWFSDPHKCETFKTSMRSLKGTRVGNDSISSASIVPRQTSGANSNHTKGKCYPGDSGESIAVYQHPDFGGKCKILQIGTYSDSKQMGFNNDSISSIEFARNPKVNVLICQNNKFGGRCEELRGTDTNLYDNRVGDNAITSIKVLRR